MIFLEELAIQVFHTPGHSSGSISLYIPADRVFICGDVLPEEGTLPIYENVDKTFSSLDKIKKIESLDILLSSLSRKISKDKDVIKHIESGENYLQRIQYLVDRFKKERNQSISTRRLTEKVFRELDLPETGIMPIVETSIFAHL